MDDYQFVIETFLRLETQLRSIGGEGRRFGNDLKSVEYKLSTCLAKHLAYINQ
jgi:hypothetical protein